MTTITVVNCNSRVAIFNLITAQILFSHHVIQEMLAPGSNIHIGLTADLCNSIASGLCRQHESAWLDLIRVGEGREDY